MAKTAMHVRLESLVLWLIPALILQSMSYFFSDGYAPDLSELLLDPEGVSYLAYMLPLLGALAMYYAPAIVTAVWIWRTENSRNGRMILWAFAALLLEYWVLIPYLGAYFAAKMSTDVPQES